jgi:hypothetical protein
MTSTGGWAATVLNADIAIRFAFSSRPAGAGIAWAQPGFAPPEFGRLAWRCSTVKEGVTRFNGILKIGETWRTNSQKGARDESRACVQTFKTSFTALAGEKESFFDAAILIFSPLAGLRPSRSGEALTLNFPNPAKELRRRSPRP